MAAGDKKKPTGKPRRRERKSIPRGQAHIQATFNNTIVTLTDPNGNVISWGSAGGQGFKGSRKSTPYAAQVTAEAAARKAMEHGLRQIEVFVKGPGSGREAAIRSLQNAGRPGKTSENLLQVLEMRLDNLVYRLGFADSRAQARQLVNHGHFAVNGRKTDIPSFIAKPNDVISVRERSKGLEYFKTRALLLAQKGVPAWLSLNIDEMTGRVMSLPSRTELELPFEEQMVVEYYQR